ncbi:MAG: hypothetical protein MZW92_48150 [Comamonadaceae bacterium]|nr:hypothetical protein [Comamonadaceae bacterium]
MNAPSQDNVPYSLSQLVNLNLKVDGVSLYGDPNGVNAFSNNDTCNAIVAENGRTCSTTDAYNARPRVPG